MLRPSDQLSLQPILLNGEALARHFELFTPTVLKKTLFKISNEYNTSANKNSSNVPHHLPKSITTLESTQMYDLLENDFEEFNDENELHHHTDQQNSWDKIDKGIILGVIPEFSMINQIEEINAQSNGKLHIFSINDEFELGMPRMLQPADYEKKGMQHYFMPMTDFGGGGTTKEAILSTVFKMRQIIEEDGNIYIHCKAGRARSAMIVATYLAIFPPKDANFSQFDLKGAVSYLKNKRRQVNLHEEKIKNDEQWNRLHTNSHGIHGIGKLEKASEAIYYYQTLIGEQTIQQINYLELIDQGTIFSEEQNKNFQNVVVNLNKQLPIEAFNNPSKIESFKAEQQKTIMHGATVLSSLAFKNYLLQLTSFKQLKIAGSLSKKTTNHEIKVLLNEILLAQNDDWFEKRFTDFHNPFRKLFAHSHNSTIGEPLNNFINDITKYKLAHKDNYIAHNQLESYMKKITEYAMNLSHIQIGLWKCPIATTHKKLLTIFDQFLQYPQNKEITLSLLKTVLKIEKQINQTIKQIEHGGIMTKKVDEDFLIHFVDFPIIINYFKSDIEAHHQVSRENNKTLSFNH